jgi:hypothetical protein
VTLKKPKSPNPIDLEEDFGNEWGENSLLDIEADLEGLERSGELDDSGIPGVQDESDENLLGDLDLELDEWEEYVDSQWNKLIE